MVSSWIEPQWSAPENIRAFCTTRQGGVSQSPYDSFNLAEHVGDDPLSVEENRKRLEQVLSLPESPLWLNQQHTAQLFFLDGIASRKSRSVADAAWSAQRGRVAVVMTADCIPVLVTNRKGSLVAAIHAGWKGLAKGIVRKSLKALPEESANLISWIGPSIRQAHFEVGQDVYDAFCNKSSQATDCFQPRSQSGKYLCDLPGLLKLELTEMGVGEVYDSGLCTYEDESRFYSYRRDGQTGRMASLIWIDDEMA